MEDNIGLWLADIKRSIVEIYTFLPEDHIYATFQKDIKTRKAIKRNLEIIGEALGRILRINPDINITNSRRIVNTRNRIIHGYDTVSEAVIWTIAVKELPELEKEIDSLLQ